MTPGRRGAAVLFCALIAASGVAARQDAKTASLRQSVERDLQAIAESLDGVMGYVALDLASGEERWTSGPTGDEYWSLVAQGKRILALSDTGTLRLIAADPGRYEVLGERELVGGPSWAHLAVVPGAGATELHVREQDAYRVFLWGS